MENGREVASAVMEYTRVKLTSYGVECTLDLGAAVLVVDFRELDRYQRHPMRGLGRWDGEYVRWERVRALWRSGALDPTPYWRQMEILDGLTPALAQRAECRARDGCDVDPGECCGHGEWAPLCAREPYGPVPCGRMVRLSRRERHEKSCVECRLANRNHERRWMA